MNYIVLNGINSQTIEGLLIQSLPPISKPAMRTQTEEIDGRDGDIITNLGYSAYDRTLTIGLYGNFDIDSIIAFFNSSGTAIFSNEKDKIYTYSMNEQIDFERLIRFRTAEITLHVQPFKFSTAESPLTLEAQTVSGTGTTVTLTPTNENEVLNSFSIYGNSVQNGTPTPASPITIQDVAGTIGITFKNADNTLTSSISLNLSGVPLRKVGTYQDFIHQLNGEWVKRNAIGTVRVDTTTITLISSYSNVVYAAIPIPTDALSYGNYKDIQCLCSHAQYSYGLNEGWNTANAVNKIFTQADANNFWLGFAAGTSLAQIKNALDGCFIYYPLLERTDVTITSGTLINQLNEVLGVSLYEGSTVITSTGNVAATINASAVNESFTVKNIGNIYSRPKITIYGSGIIYVSVNGLQIFTITLNDESYITIDGAAMEAYQDTTDVLKNRLVTGNYENFVFNVGLNTISFDGSVTQLTVENYSRWI